MAEREQTYYEHFVKWREKTWPDVKKIGTPTDELAFCVSHYISTYPGRMAPMVLELIREKTYEPERARGEVSDDEKPLRSGAQGEPDSPQEMEAD